MNRNAEALRGPHSLAHAHNPDLKSWHRELGHHYQFVCRQKGIKNSGQAQIEHTVESKHVDTHGKHDSKYGDLASTNKCALGRNVGTGRTSAQGELGMLSQEIRNAN
jgi:hypothetical protein